MKKRILMMLLIAVMVISGVSCSKENSDDKSENNQKTESPDSKSEKDNNSETDSDIKYADMIPDPKQIFKNGIVSIITADGGKGYAFRVTNYADGEYETYVEECKKMGFDNIHYEGENDGGKMFMAYTSDEKYYLQVFLGYQINAIDISCKQSSE